MKTTKIYVGYHLFPIFIHGTIEMTLKEPIEIELAKQKAKECDFTNDDFVEDLQEELEALLFNSTYAFFVDKYDAEDWAVCYYL